MCGLMHRVIKMHYAHQRMPCFKTEIPVYLSMVSASYISISKFLFAKLARINGKAIVGKREYVIRVLLAVIEV